MGIETTYIHQKRAKGKKPQSQNLVTEQRRDRGQFNYDTIHGLKLTRMEYVIPSQVDRKRRRSEFQGSGNREGVRSLFLKMLAKDHEKELRENLGLTDADIKLMSEGKSVNGYNVHHKLPIHGGGKNEFSNFILMPLYPHDQLHRDVMDMQIGSRSKGDSTILVPWTNSMIYNPNDFGYTKENQKVDAGYISKVNESNYPKIYKKEHLEDKETRKREIEKFSKKSNGSKPQEKTIQALKSARGAGR